MDRRTVFRFRVKSNNKGDDETLKTQSFVNASVWTGSLSSKTITSSFILLKCSESNDPREHLPLRYQYKIMEITNGKIKYYK